MPNNSKLKNPWLVAVWPGMGHVALSAGFYLMSKLDMRLLAEMSAPELYDADFVEVNGGIIRPGRLPRNRLFVWTDPNERHDLVVFIGEAQPPLGKRAFCHRLIEYARELEIERVFTFAAMATNMHPSNDPRVFAAATDDGLLAELSDQSVEILQEGHIGGLNGILLGVAGENQLQGMCLLGEMPQMFAQLPFPKASLAVLKVLAGIANITVDFNELEQQSEGMEDTFTEILTHLEGPAPEQEGEQEAYSADLSPVDQLTPQDLERIEMMFDKAGDDRSSAYELKRELDRLRVFSDFEDRFLDLFSNPE